MHQTPVNVSMSTVRGEEAAGVGEAAVPVEWTGPAGVATKGAGRAEADPPCMERDTWAGPDMSAAITNTRATATARRLFSIWIAPLRAPRRGDRPDRTSGRPSPSVLKLGVALPAHVRSRPYRRTAIR